MTRRLRLFVLDALATLVSVVRVVTRSADDKLENVEDSLAAAASRLDSEPVVDFDEYLAARGERVPHQAPTQSPEGLGQTAR